MMKENWIYRRGDIYIANLGEPVGSEQGGIRPVLVIQNNVGNRFSPTLEIAPLTSRDKRPGLPAHYILHREHVSCLKRTSTVLCEQTRSIDKGRILGYIGKVHSEQMSGVDRALEVEFAHRRSGTGKKIRNQIKNQTRSRQHCGCDCPDQSDQQKLEKAG
ncbi:MAG: type II toxin-antitoxin system PemK/MazF family toxin [Lachnospiraceae bacterium]|nr:type II toxin-antitoxin system PemK/MazF family toxin [Lachnospiraceae bacterium]